MITSVLASLALAGLFMADVVWTLRAAFFSRWPQAGMRGGLALLLLAPMVTVMGHLIVAALLSAAIGAVLLALGAVAWDRQRGSGHQ